MRVIFLKDVPRVGRKYDIKEVNDGYAMNFLFSRKLAVVATPKAVAELEMKKKEIIIEREVQEDLLMKNLEEIKDKAVIIKCKTNDQGHLFSAIHKKEILDEMSKRHHIEINEEFIILEKPIKEVGEFKIPIEIKNKKSSFQLIIEKI
ncbi:50S ribosomal protein L9 [Candidatus Nomurabacteria bacterium RIFCSPHIGHO2_01_FULL_37_25]|uniref:Large ribosomal subunit protein bL9 n=1 Tax=Candidatus Nomurabacteria bacterium RIFCSPLOWO2_01_FULL_36_16 TaxID=1801767 RepID=A0A1F6WY51_9BACT|nr:MAG: 50S ribosomal protein L9 [Candidatus Nomurabacteria bacterium RIFCSPHIGHO2_01_FULL_37_25]OGI75166.1 MAG: 50S ribosomal protein L9 [Candidatus Nomurabacteria bacterium RIFCSPHIGHO2_02_FULL_36_29]OGI86821.1 MAG: 50S ribosomal protein L9 [Candidatus Nomurabacteria bacterium RIFCSPLOWO2_01_FULL_36_16]OGI95299.1 MAG: 50S ribosomal protein L9 [Candidatus Nomurabacteria bacterium RIFCSPLOWO2_02_FULL_36_8]